MRNVHMPIATAVPNAYLARKIYLFFIFINTLRIEQQNIPTFSRAITSNAFAYFYAFT
ncbi:hypothetical protein TERTU_4236 [Teredinibacter turnerae T7901]|uniref:Uncharacterized protein n=1 Tax=Teredinibacter turnerae (strain ATCC 39867 / T7901) TaxID=377629 RepID=C5BI61_TERTT|nr:hypothetical protein TERTU_4236 [Teredinibacter turnerae T7901]